MGNNANPSYIFLKGNVYYFIRHVPFDVRPYYKSGKVILCLKTKRRFEALRAAKSIAQRLEDYWLSLRIANIDIPGVHLLRDNLEHVSKSSCVKLSEALNIYLKLKGINKVQTFYRGANRNIKSVIGVLGDRPLDNYSSLDAASFRDYLLKRGLTVSSVKRNFSTIRSIFNLTIQEHGLDINNPFSKTYMPDLDDKQIRESIPTEAIKHIQSLCRECDDDLRWLIALLSDTGMRLGEGVGLLKSDINLDCETPHIKLVPHTWRPLKTRSSNRVIPLVNESLWACKRILEDNDDSLFAFPRYSSVNVCNANSASAALNKWLKDKLKKKYVVHGFRHSFRDRLRAVECPSEIIDQLGGWSLKSVGQGYGKGYALELLAKWILKLKL
jgi:integrase